MSTSLITSDQWLIYRYSGDTKPCQALIAAGKDATLLIHEATLEDDKPEVAAHKGHSTFSQAIDIGIQSVPTFSCLDSYASRLTRTG
jgi:ribonuclease Z